MKRRQPPKKRPAPTTDSRIAQAKRIDGWQSVFSGMGTVDRDKRLGISFSEDAALTQNTLRVLYKQDDIVARVCDIFPHEMLREGISLPTDTDGGLDAELRKLRLRTKLKEALTWARLDGGAIIVLGANDGRRIDRPLDEAKLRDITYLTVFDRWEARVASYYTDPFAPNYGEPEMYEIVTPDATVRSAGNLRIHASRCLRFEGQLTKRIEKANFFGWGAGVIDRVYAVIRDFVASYAGASLILQEYSIGKYKIKGLADALDADEEGLVLQRLKLLDMAKSAFRSIPLDGDLEDFEKTSSQTAGLSDLLDKMGVRLSAATGIPLPLLLGQSPGGLQSTGAHEEANFYNVVKAMQMEHLDEPLAKLLRVVAKAKGLDVLDARGEVPFEYRSLWQPSDLETAQAHEHQANADEKYLAAGVLTPQEVADSRFKARYSLDTTLDPSVTEREPPESPSAEDPGAVADPTESA